MNSIIDCFKQKQKINTSNLEQGFTIIELLIVVIVIGILSAISLPQFLDQASRARQTEAETTLGTINRAQQLYRLENPEFGTLNQLSQTGNISINNLGDYYQFTATPDGSSPGTITKANATSAPAFTNDIVDYEAAIFRNANGILYSVMCRGNDPTVAPQADANPTVTNTCANSREVQ